MKAIANPFQTLHFWEEKLAPNLRCSSQTTLVRHHRHMFDEIRKKIKIYPVRLSFGEKINHKMHLGLHHCAVLETVGAYTRRSASSQQSLGVLRSWTGVYAYTSNNKISVKPMTTEGSLSNSVCM
jgi:hypothetical protein